MTRKPSLPAGSNRPSPELRLTLPCDPQETDGNHPTPTYSSHLPNQSKFCGPVPLLLPETGLV